MVDELRVIEAHVARTEVSIQASARQQLTLTAVVLVAVVVVAILTVAN